jgi:prophage DNA circulation protein
MPSPYKVKLDSYLLNILDITDSIAPAIASHEFLGLDGAFLQNMGNRPRTIRFKCYFFGTASAAAISNPNEKQPYYENHRGFLNQITDSSIDHVFIHPKYGTVSGVVTNTTITHDDTQQYVAIDIELTEQGIKGKSTGRKDFDVDLATQQQYLKQINNQLGAASGNIQQSGFATMLGQVVDKAQPITNQLKGLSNKARGYAKEVDRVVGIVNTFASQITQPISSLEATINYANDVPSTIIQSVQRCSERIQAMTALTATSPVRLIRATNQASDDLCASLTTGVSNSTTGAGNQYTQFFVNIIRGHMAGRTAYQLGIMFKQDQNNRSQQQQRDKLRSFDVNGTRTVTGTSPDTMSRQEIEEALAAVRLAIQTAITADRDSAQDLKDLANTLVIYADQVKLLSQQITTLTVSNQPMHVICMALGQTYQTAERFLKLNPQIKNPNFVDGTISVYAA